MKEEKAYKEKFRNAMIGGLTNLHIADLIIWDVVMPWKRKAFLKAINDGMSWEFAYRKAKETPLIKHKQP
jgi:hypothetical protein